VSPNAPVDGPSVATVRQSEVGDVRFVGGVDQHVGRYPSSPSWWREDETANVWLIEPRNEPHVTDSDGNKLRPTAASTGAWRHARNRDRSGLLARRPTWPPKQAQGAAKRRSDRPSMSQGAMLYQTGTAPAPPFRRRPPVETLLWLNRIRARRGAQPRRDANSETNAKMSGENAEPALPAASAWRPTSKVVNGETGATPSGWVILKPPSATRNPRRRPRQC